MDPERTGAFFDGERAVEVMDCIRSAQRFLAVSQPDRATPVFLLEDL